MGRLKIQQVFDNAWKGYAASFCPSHVQEKAASSIMDCKSGKLGCNVSVCTDCGHMDFHNNSCRNRNCPSCQALLKELWIDARKAEVIDAPYFHVVFTIPAQLNPLVYANQALLYSLLHRCSAQTLLELSADRRFLGATPGIIQVLHTWGQELNFHPHIHCIVSGGGLSRDGKLRTCGSRFFIPARVLAAKFRGKLLASLDALHKGGKLSFPASCSSLVAPAAWASLRDRLYNTAWCPHIRETFNGFGNAIEYLGRYANRIAITNSRVKSVSADSVTFWAEDYRNNSSLKEVTLSCREFIRRFMMHVLPPGFQKIRYYGFLSNRFRKERLAVIFRIQGHQRFKSMLAGLPMDQVLYSLWGVNVHVCTRCGCLGMRPLGRSYVLKG